MDEHFTDDESDDLQEMHRLLLEVDVLDGPPGLRDIVAELWPELLHKIKPPVSEMH
jgi:hypothetical protein